MRILSTFLVLLFLTNNTLAQPYNEEKNYKNYRGEIRLGTVENPEMVAIPLPDQESISIDGVLSEGIWSKVPTATGFTQRVPHDGKAASQQTEVKVLYTQDHIYIGAVAYESSPDSILAPLFRKDGTETSDWFVAGFDSYNDNRTAFVFAVNPRGVQQDLMVINDRSNDLSWDAVWESKAQINKNSWTVEMKIPLSQLRFNSKAEVQNWGVNFQRIISRKGENSYWSPIPQSDAGIVSNFGKLSGIKNLKEPKRLEIIPFASADLTRVPKQNTENPYYSRNTLTSNFGADIRYGVTSDLTLSATINPDFGQVEADPAVINLTANESFFNEKRPFFLEGRDIFQFGATKTFIRYAPPTMFYSRRIGRSPQINSNQAGKDAEFVDQQDYTTIATAAKLSGKTQSGWSVGILDAYTLQENSSFTTESGEEGNFAAEPATNYLVGRVKKDFNSGKSYVGGFVSGVNRAMNENYFEDYLHSSAYLGGVDYEHRFGNDNWIASGAISYSSVHGAEKAIERTQRSPVRYFNRVGSDKLSVEADKTNLSGFATELSLQKGGGKDNWLGAITYSEISPGFESNDLGFQTRSDLRWVGGILAYRETSPKHLQYYEFFAGYDRGWNYDGDLLRNSIVTGGFLTFKNQWRATYNLGFNLKQYTDRITRGGPVMERPEDWNLIVELNSNSNKSVYYTVGYNPRREVAGEFDNTFWVGLNFRPFSFIKLNISPEYSHTKDIDQYITAVADINAVATYGKRYVFSDIEQHTFSTSLRLDWTFSPKMSLQTYVRPFISSGNFSRFKEVAEPYTYDYEVYGVDKGSITKSGNEYTVEPGEAGSSSFSFNDPNYNFLSVQGNAVFRWEYMPGSTLYLVWQQQREDALGRGNFDLGRDFDDLLNSKPTNVFLVKLSYWFGS